MVLEDEQMSRDRAREELIQAERRSHTTANELEESKSQLEHADRQRREAEQDLSDTAEQLSDVTLQNQALESNKRKLESEIQTLHVSKQEFCLGVAPKTLSSQADIEEMLVETQLAEDRAKKTMIDTARLAGMPFPLNIDI